MEAVHTLQLGHAIPPERFVLLGDFNAHLGRAAAGTVPAEYLVAARTPGFAGFPLLPA